MVVAGVVSLVTAVVHHPFAFWLVSDTTLLAVLRVALIVLRVGWAPS